MSNRKKAFSKSSSNPATKFLEWKSDKKCFSYYDKEKGENVDVQLPIKFLTLQEMHTVKGWDDKSQSGIYSNEVKNIGKEELEVKSFKGGLIAKGVYKDIKDIINQKGGHYSKSIYIMTEGGEINNIQLKGSGVQSWGDFTQKSSSRLPDEWVSVVSAEERTKGRIKYTVPVFEYSGTLDTKSERLADDAFDTLESYLDGYSEKVESDDIVTMEVESLGF